MTPKPDRCAEHPFHAANSCQVCVSDHKGGEHRGRPSTVCVVCRVEARYAQLQYDMAVDVARRAANDYR